MSSVEQKTTPSLFFIPDTRNRLHRLDVGRHGRDTRNRACVGNEVLDIRPRVNDNDEHHVTDVDGNVDAAGYQDGVRAVLKFVLHSCVTISISIGLRSRYRNCLLPLSPIESNQDRTT
jgi:hypothetical protein